MALLHYLITGRAPNQAEPDRLLREYGVDARRLMIVETAFAAQAARRYPSAQAFLRALRSLELPIAGAAAPDEEAVIQLLGTTSRAELAVLVHQAQLGFSRAEPAKYAKERHPYLATLLCGVRQCVVLLGGGRWSDAWQDEDELVAVLAQLIALRGGATVADQGRAREVLARSTQIGWLSETKYDAWRPGMRSGSGIRSRYQASALGKQLLVEAGISI